MWWLVGATAVVSDLPFRLEVGDYVVGRSKSAAIVISDVTVSRQHAKLRSRRQSVQLTDLKSCNGTFLNDVPVTQVELKAGDRVRFGAVTCVLTQSPLERDDLCDAEITYPIPSGTQTMRFDGLTAAQSLVAIHLLEGCSETDIAIRLNKSQHTIHTHVKAIFQRLGVHSRADLILHLLQLGGSKRHPRSKQSAQKKRNSARTDCYPG